MRSCLLSSVCSYCVLVMCMVFFFKQKTAYEVRISDWSSDVCSSDLAALDYFSVPERIYMEQAIFSVPASSSVQPHDITKGGLVYSDGRVKVFAAENTHYQTFNAGRDKSDRKSTRLNSSH